MRESCETAESAEVGRSPQRSSDVFQRCSKWQPRSVWTPPPVLAFHAKELKQGLEAVSEAAGSTVARSRAAASGARPFAAAEEGDLEGLEELLAHDVVLRGDGGGKALALKRAVHGRARAARTLIASLRARTRFGITSRREEVNGQPGALFFDREGRLIGVMSLDVAEGQIQGVSSIVNPDKLRHLGPLADLEALLRERS